MRCVVRTIVVGVAFALVATTTSTARAEKAAMLPLGARTYTHVPPPPGRAQSHLFKFTSDVTLHLGTKEVAAGAGKALVLELQTPTAPANHPYFVVAGTIVGTSTSDRGFRQTHVMPFAPDSPQRAEIVKHLAASHPGHSVGFW